MNEFLKAVNGYKTLVAWTGYCLFRLIWPDANLPAILETEHATAPSWMLVFIEWLGGVGLGHKIIKRFGL